MLRINSYPERTSFKANLNSPKLKLSQKDFFIKIRGYNKNTEWAKKIKETTDCSVNLIRKNTTAENTLKLIIAGVANANYCCFDLGKKHNTGILRTQRENWRDSWYDRDVYTAYGTGRYSCYKERLDNVYKQPLKINNRSLAISKPNKKHDIEHGQPELINNSLNYVFDLYKNKYTKFLSKDVKKEDLPEIIDVIAEIRWVLAHATPWLRGSDAISNVFMRAMFKAVGVKAYPPAKGISFDLEAFCTNLNEYKKSFPNFFEKPPIVIE